jgi:hypothetical protein
MDSKMTNNIKRLRALDEKFRTDGLYGDEVKEYQNALPTLLNRLEKLEAVVEQVGYLQLTKRYGSYSEVEERLQILFKTFAGLKGQLK